MDKYEYKLSLDAMQSAVEQGNYAAASKAADKINWKKVRDVNSLLAAGEVYHRVGNYEKTRDVYRQAYLSSSVGKKIIYRICEIAIETGHLEDAEHFYNEYVGISPLDSHKFLLLFKMSRAKGDSLAEQIKILEDLRELDRSEDEPLYELANLYSQAGMADKCVEACDELVLWFSESEYLEKTLKLKMQYESLTKEQEAKLTALMRENDGIIQVRANEDLESGEIVAKSVYIPEVRTRMDKFSTQNLQQEIAKSVAQIMEATKKETVIDTMDSVKRLVEDIPYLQDMVDLRTDPLYDTGEIGTIYEGDDMVDQEVYGSLNEMLEVEPDGQMGMKLSGRRAKDDQIKGQLSLDDMLADWNRTQQMTQEAMYAAESRKLENARARALQEINEILEAIKIYFPDSEMVEVFERAKVDPNTQNLNAASAAIREVNDELQDRIDRLAKGHTGSLPKPVEEPVVQEIVEPEIPEEEIETNGMEEVLDRWEAIKDPTRPLPDVTSADDLPEIDLDVLGKEELLEAEKKWGPKKEHTLEPVEEEAEAEAEEEADNEEEVELPVIEIPAFDEEGNEIEEEQRPDKTQKYEPVNVVEEEVVDREPEDEPKPIEEIAGETKVLPDVSAIDREIESQINKEMSNLSANVAEIGEQTQKEEKAKEEEKAKKVENKPKVKVQIPIKKLSIELRDLFSYFSNVKGMEPQICRAINACGAALLRGNDRTGGNLTIDGAIGTGKTMLAQNMVKALQITTGLPSSKVGMIRGEILNHKSIPELMKKIDGGCLIVEQAGDIQRNTAEALATYLSTEGKRTFVILEDQTAGINRILKRSAAFAKSFSEHIRIPQFSNDDLVEFAKKYANDAHYSIDPMALLALHTKVNNITKIDQSTTISSVREVVDAAIKRSERGKIWRSIIGKRRDEDGYIILREKDFE